MNTNQILHDPSLDNDDKLEELAKYYDKHDLFEVSNPNKGKINKPKIRKISINIPESTYETASILSSETGTGYQNILKIAMSIGISELKSKIHQNQ